jgi:hypothetical protein
MNLKSFLAALVIAGLAGDALAQGTTATLIDGTILNIKQPLELFATEGPVWDLDTDSASFTAMGQRVTIPSTVDGVSVGLGGTSFLAADGTPTVITAETIDRLLDQNATLRDIGGSRLGAARSLFSTVENRRTDAQAPVTRNPDAELLMESNYFSYLQACYPAHAAFLPADYLHRAGVRGGNEIYPAVSGGTLKSAGHVYTDASGAEYLIPDLELAVELAENVVGGAIRSIDPGNGADIPPSLVIGELLVILNQDPRFATEVLGLGLQSLPLEVLFTPENIGLEIVVGGYGVGESLMFGMTFENEELVDATAPLIVTPTTWRFRDSKDLIRIKGVTSSVENVALFALILGQELEIPLVADLVGGVFDLRTEGDVNVADVTEVTIEARDTETGAVLSSETYKRADVE